MVNPRSQLLHMDAPPAVQSAPVLGEPFGQLHSQTAVLGHSFGVGLVSGSQPDAVQPTKPGVPDLPAATPHFVAHPVGSVRSHVPKEWDVVNNQGQKNQDKDTALLSLLHYYQGI